MWRRVGLVKIDVSEERVASIFRVKNTRARKSDRLTLSLAFVISSTLKMEAYVPPKRRCLQDLHCATSQKTIFFNITIDIFAFLGCDSV
jgi:hypothetical protein